jgi:hypothetical protein
VNEVTVAFGAEQHLVGTLALPTQAPGAVAFLLLNAGVIHRIGPHRIGVKLARRLAAVGIASLRFDFSGQGDSRSPRAAAPYDRQAVKDIRSAIDHVQRLTGIRHFVIAGICSGADHGFVAAQEDARVVGLWMMDGYTYTTARTRMRYYRRRLEEGFAAASWIGRRLRALPAGIARAVARTRDEQRGTIAWGRTTPTREAYAAMMQSLVDRGVNVFVMYSGTFLARYSYAEQYRDCFGEYRFVDAVRCDFAPQIDHTVISLAAQQELIATLCEWALRIRFPATGATAWTSGDAPPVVVTV